MGSTGKRYTEEQIIRILKELETGKTVEEASRRRDRDQLLTDSAMSHYQKARIFVP